MRYRRIEVGQLLRSLPQRGEEGGDADEGAPGALMLAVRIGRETDPLLGQSSSVEIQASRASWAGTLIDLTLTEFKIVALLALRIGEPVSYREIYDLLHGKDFVAGYGDEGYRANVRTFIKRIRTKFRAADPAFEHIHNYADFGYRWTGD